MRNSLRQAPCSAGVSATGDLVNSATQTVERTTVNAVSLFNTEGVVYMLTHAVSNFTGFAPLGVVLVAMLGVGVAEQSGYISALLKRAVERLRDMSPLFKKEEIIKNV